MTAFNIVLSCFLVLLIFMLLMAFKRMHREMTWYKKNIDRPEFLPFVLQRMVKTVEKSGEWQDLEHMRYQVRAALSDIDRLRHDKNNATLQKSKSLINQ